MLPIHERKFLQWEILFPNEACSVIEHLWRNNVAIAEEIGMMRRMWFRWATANNSFDRAADGFDNLDG